MNALQIIELEKVERRINLVINKMDWSVASAYMNATVDGALFRPRQELMASLNTISHILASEKAAFCFEAQKAKSNNPLSIYEQINKDTEKFRNSLWDKAIQAFKKQWEDEHIKQTKQKHIGRTDLPRKKGMKKPRPLTAKDFED